MAIIPIRINHALLTEQNMDKYQPNETITNGYCTIIISVSNCMGEKNGQNNNNNNNENYIKK